MSGSGPRISIVVAVLDAAAALPSCLASVFEQSWPERELVVVDGGSTDGTVAILRRESARIAHWESSRDRGICHAWNKALERVRGEWVLFLGADDRLASPDALARAASELGRNGSACGVVYGSVAVLGPNGALRAVVGRPWSEARVDFAHRMAIPHQATFHHRSLFERHGRFDESFRICGDYEFLLRELKAGQARFLPGIVVTAMAGGGLSDRAGSALVMCREFERARRMHGLSRLPLWLSARLLRARCRDWLARSLGPGAAESAARTYRALAGRRRP